MLTVNLFNQVSARSTRLLHSAVSVFQQIFTLLWIWYVLLFVLNIYSIGSWIGRLAVYRNRYAFIHSRLARSSRDEVPRFRFDFKHSSRELGDHVHAALVRAFITEYLEPDGYFFIRVLTVNVSDFVVQEVIEQLWTRYVRKYGENDAKLAESAFLQFRNVNSQTSVQTARTTMLSVVEDATGATDAKRQYIRQRADVNTGLLTVDNDTTELLESFTQPRNEQV